MKKTLLAATVVLALLVPASIATAASLPKPADSTVVVPSSIAGIKLGMAEGKAKAAWGASRGKCSVSKETGFGRCEYGSFTGAGGYAIIDFAGKVTSVSIGAGKDSDGNCVPSLGAAVLKKIKTSAGIGLGSKFSQLQKAYPKGTVSGETSDPSQFRVRGKGASEFVFTIVDRKVCGFGILGG